MQPHSYRGARSATLVSTAPAEAKQVRVPGIFMLNPEPNMRGDLEAALLSTRHQRSPVPSPQKRGLPLTWK